MKVPWVGNRLGGMDGVGGKETERGVGGRGRLVGRRRGTRLGLPKKASSGLDAEIDTGFHPLPEAVCH